MNREIIERLAIDSVAGELNEDAETLFRLYLDEHPQANQWANDIRQVYGQTESAIQAKTACTNVEQPVPIIRPVSRLTWLPVARWAAVIFLGAVIGFTAGRWEVTGETQSVVIKEPGPESESVKNVTDLKEKYVGTFWGDKMLALVDNTSRHQHKVNLRDIRSWESYRQFRKENHNE